MTARRARTIAARRRRPRTARGRTSSARPPSKSGSCAAARSTISRICAFDDLRASRRGSCAAPPGAGTGRDTSRARRRPRSATRAASRCRAGRARATPRSERSSSSIPTRTCPIFAIASTPRSGREPCAATPRRLDLEPDEARCAIATRSSVGSVTIAASARMRLGDRRRCRCSPTSSSATARDDHVAAQPSSRGPRAGEHDRRQARLHVVGAAPVQPVALDARLERLAPCPRCPTVSMWAFSIERPAAARAARDRDHVPAARRDLLAHAPRARAASQPGRDEAGDLLLAGPARHEVRDSPSRSRRARAPGRSARHARHHRSPTPRRRFSIIAPVDVLRLTTLLEELPTERTRLLDNLGRVRREIGPITPELSDALADRMNIRRGEVHEVVSFYSFLRVPTEAVRVCIGPVCDCMGAQELLAREQEHADGVPVARRRVPRPLRHRAGAPARRHGRARSRPPDERRALDRPRAGRRDARRLRGARRPRGAPRRCPSRETIVAELKASGLAGLGGAGFPTGVKWEAVRAEPGPRYVVVNADEGEPGTIKDRYVMELRPHLMLEGDADRDAGRRGRPKGSSTCARSTRPARARLDRARSTSSARPASSTGSSLELVIGAGAYICGEETAMLESHGGPPRDAAPQAALPEPGRLPRAADAHQQRRDARPRPGDPAHGRRGVGGARPARSERRPALVGHRRGRAARLLRGAERRRRSASSSTSTRAARPTRSARSCRAARRAGSSRRPRSTCRSRATSSASGVPASARPAVQVFPARYPPLRLLAETIRFFAEESCQKCTPCRIGNRGIHHVLAGARARPRRDVARRRSRSGSTRW